MSEKIKYDGVIHKWSIYEEKENKYRIMGVVGNVILTTSVVERIEGDVAYTKSGHKYKLRDPLFSYRQIASTLTNIKREFYKTYE